MTAAEILAQLDDCADRLVFPMLDAPGFRLAAARLHAYRDPDRWAMVIETLGCHVWDAGHAAIDNCLHVFGNCLSRPPGVTPDDYLYPTADSDEGQTFDDRGRVRREARTIRLRGRVIQLPDQSPVCNLDGSPIAYGRRWRSDELLRWLTEAYRDDLLATEDELRARIPPDIPKLLTLDAWRHPDLGSGETPSQSETFRQIAEVLASGDPARYRPTQPPNTPRRRRPVGGASCD
ncbi:MAG: hypothetical protein NZ585_14325 [Chloracidobacterium sp.]|nr:hypothetical protein [Chloracidobacterium sp.]MDW8217894.1 hypothetical protein [Acidobacteriota bacterium]